MAYLLQRSDPSLASELDEEKGGLLKAALGTKAAKTTKEGTKEALKEVVDSEKSESKLGAKGKKAKGSKEPSLESQVSTSNETQGSSKQAKLDAKSESAKLTPKEESLSKEVAEETPKDKPKEVSSEADKGKKTKAKKTKQEPQAQSEKIADKEDAKKSVKNEGKKDGKSLAGALLGAAGAAAAAAGAAGAINTPDSKESGSKDMALAQSDELEVAKSPLEELGSLGKGTKANNQNLAKGSTLAQSIAALESGAIKEGKSGKDSKDDRRGKDAKATKSEKSSETQKNEATKAATTSLEANLTPQELEVLEGEEKTGFAEMFLANGGKKKAKGKEVEGEEALKESKGVAKQTSESITAKEAQRTQILYRSAMAKESVRNFAQALREEILNYKPPITKLSLELNPQNLGTLELTITKKGKDLHVQVISNSAAIGLFVQNQNDFRTNLAQMGFENVDLSFSANDGGGGKNQGSQGEGSGQNQGYSESNEPEGNKNSLEDSQMATRMDIILPKYV